MSRPYRAGFRGGGGGRIMNYELGIVNGGGGGGGCQVELGEQVRSQVQLGNEGSAGSGNVLFGWRKFGVRWCSLVLPSGAFVRVGFGGRFLPLAHCALLCV
jgi:hypothetical protein